MSSKYDTNPLDPDFPEKVRREAEAEVATQVLGQGSAPTRQFAPESEEQTRRFVDNDLSGFSGVTGQAAAPARYQPAVPATDQSIYRKIEKVGLPENMLIAAPYIPWFIGLVAGVLLLLLVPRSESKVRFHAAQGLAAHIGILLVSTVLGIVGSVTDLANVGNAIFTLVTSIMLVIFAIKAWRGKPVHIESVEDLTNWLDEKISPKLG